MQEVRSKTGTACVLLTWMAMPPALCASNKDAAPLLPEEPSERRDRLLPGCERGNQRGGCAVRAVLAQRRFRRHARLVSPAALACIVLLMAPAGRRLSAQDAPPMTVRDACHIVAAQLPAMKQASLYNGKSWPSSLTRPIQKMDVKSVTLTPSGFALSSASGDQISISYVEIHPFSDEDMNYPRYAGWNIKNRSTFQMLLCTKDSHCLVSYFPSEDAYTKAAEKSMGDLIYAFKSLVSLANAHQFFDCSHHRMPLEEFTAQTAAWRALAAKPPVSDEVTKKRLLAEDAYEHKDFSAALEYYEAGTALDPTWAWGWFNAAILYGEMGQYNDAADCMKRYLILLPDANDAAAAKEKLLLWEAKAEEAGGK